MINNGNVTIDTNTVFKLTPSSIHNEILKIHANNGTSLYFVKRIVRLNNSKNPNTIIGNGLFIPVFVNTLLHISIMLIISILLNISICDMKCNMNSVFK